MSEEWRPIPGFPHYLASDLGAARLNFDEEAA